MVGELTPLFYLAGIAIGTSAVEYVMEKMGHGDKNTLVRIVGYSTAAVYSFRTWFSYLHRIASVFGVFI